MNENIDLTKILKNCPIGEEFYSPMLGDVVLHHVNHKKKRVYVVLKISNMQAYINADGTLDLCSVSSQEIMLYPSRDQRDWSKFTAPWYKKEKFDPKTLKPFDRILVRDACAYSWRCALYSHTKENESTFKYVTGGSTYKYCIPYNDDTKYLVGTKNEASEYYRYWED